MVVLSLVVLEFKDSYTERNYVIEPDSLGFRTNRPQTYYSNASTKNGQIGQ